MFPAVTVCASFEATSAITATSAHEPLNSLGNKLALLITTGTNVIWRNYLFGLEVSGFGRGLSPVASPEEVLTEWQGLKASNSWSDCVHFTQ